MTSQGPEGEQHPDRRQHVPGPPPLAPTHPQAVVALVLGIVGVIICPPLGIAALVLGLRARNQMEAMPERYSGRGLATAAFALGLLSVVFTLFWVVVIGMGLSGYFDV